MGGELTIQFHVKRGIQNNGNNNNNTRHGRDVGRDNSVGIATRYGMEVRGSNPSGSETFRTCPDRPWGPQSLLCNG